MKQRPSEEISGGRLIFQRTVMWLWLMQLGFVGFLVAMFGFIWRGSNREGQFSRAAWPWLLAAICCFALWFIALPKIPRP